MSRPFTLHLEQSRVDEIRAGSAPAMSRREQLDRHARFRTRTNGDMLVLRHLASGRYDSPWSVKARMVPDANGGVTLQGRLRSLGDKVTVGALVIPAVALLALAVGIGVSGGVANPGFLVCSIGGVVLALVAAANVRVGATAARLRTAEAQEFLRAAFDRVTPHR